MTDDARIRTHERIRRRPEFLHVYEHGKRVRGRYATVFGLSNQLPYGRLGIAATKKIGGAVVRNRAKRVVREVFRRNKLAAGFDIVVVPTSEFLRTSQAVFEAEYQHNVARILREHR
jgi:ribonuclease P protein component